jgi:hypothetical protein
MLPMAGAFGECGTRIHEEGRHAVDVDEAAGPVRVVAAEGEQRAGHAVGAEHGLARGGDLPAAVGADDPSGSSTPRSASRPPSTGRGGPAQAVVLLESLSSKQGPSV